MPPLLGPTPGTLQHDVLAGAVLGDQVEQRQTLGGAVLWMGVIVVETGAVGQDQVGLEIFQRDLARPVLLQVFGLVQLL